MNKSEMFGLVQSLWLAVKDEKNCERTMTFGSWAILGSALSSQAIKEGAVEKPDGEIFDPIAQGLIDDIMAAMDAAVTAIDNRNQRIFAYLDASRTVSQVELPHAKAEVLARALYGYVGDAPEKLSLRGFILNGLNNALSENEGVREVPPEIVELANTLAGILEISKPEAERIFKEAIAEAHEELNGRKRVLKELLSAFR